METVLEKIERMKVKSELFLEKDIKAFIKTVYNDFYFCNILSVGEEFILIQSFKGKRQGEKKSLRWIDILEVKEYTEEGQ